MPRKIYKTKGIYLYKPKITRTLIPDILHFVILSDYISGDNDMDISRKYGKDRRQVLRTITKAKERAERDNHPLLELRSVQETLRK